jgi:hypothetical protein
LVQIGTRRPRRRDRIPPCTKWIGAGAAITDSPAAARRRGAEAVCTAAAAAAAALSFLLIDWLPIRLACLFPAFLGWNRAAVILCRCWAHRRCRADLWLGIAIPDLDLARNFGSLVWLIGWCC